MIRQILRKLGYIHESELKEPSEDELVYMLIKKLGHEDIDFPEEEEEKMFNQLKEVENFPLYLRYTAQNDKDRYFATKVKEEQGVIRGAFARTVYLRARVINPEKTRKPSDMKIQGIRYDK